MTTQNRRLLAKSISTADLNTGGHLNPEQSNKFIDYMVDNSVVLKHCTVIRMKSDTYNLDNIGVQSRIIRAGIENEAPTNVAGVSTGRRQLRVTEVILPFDIGFQFLEDNIEKQGAEDHIAQLFAAQFANDVEDLGCNGDTAAVAGPDQDFLKISDGWIKIARGEAGFHKYQLAASKDYKGVVFPGMLKAMPNKWKRNVGQLAFLVSPTVEEEYRLSLSSRSTALGDEQLVSANNQKFAGVQVVPVPFLAEGDMILTNWKNLAYGIHEREIRVGKQVQERKRLVEYTTTARVDYQWVTPDAAVVSVA